MLGGKKFFVNCGCGCERSVWGYEVRLDLVPVGWNVL